MSNVLIYSTPTCGFCQQAKAFFAEHNVAYEEKDVAADAAAREEMLEKTQQMGVPVIQVDDQIMVGFNRDKLGEMLGIAS